MNISQTQGPLNTIMQNNVRYRNKFECCEMTITPLFYVLNDDCYANILYTRQNFSRSKSGIA
jgi:hypothetical protein